MSSCSVASPHPHRTVGLLRMGRHLKRCSSSSDIISDIREEVYREYKCV
jgi:hypothetical protein